MDVLYRHNPVDVTHDQILTLFLCCRKTFQVKDVTRLVATEYLKLRCVVSESLVDDFLCNKTVKRTMDFELFKWLVEIIKISDYKEDVCWDLQDLMGNYLSSRGNLEHYQYLRCRFDPDHLKYFSSSGNIPAFLVILDQVLSEDNNGNGEDKIDMLYRTCSSIIMRNDLHLIKILIAKLGDHKLSLKDLEHYHEKLYYEAKLDCSVASDKEMVQYLRSEGLPWGTVALGVVVNNNFKLLKWLDGQGCTMPKTQDSSPVYLATGHGNFKMTKWLLKKDYVLSDSGVDQAAKGGNIKLLKWLMKRYKIKFTTRTIEGAIDSKNVKILKYVLKCLPKRGKNRIVGKKINDDVYWNVAKACNSSEQKGGVKLKESAAYKMMKMLRKFGVKWGGGHLTGLTAEYGSLEFLKWLHKKGCPMDVGYICSYAPNGACYKWVRDKFGPCGNCISRNAEDNKEQECSRCIPCHSKEYKGIKCADDYKSCYSKW